MMNFTLRQLRYFEALAEHTHFGRAAEACAVSQPALSVQIKELEQALGVVLFERGARQVRLTQFGEDFGKRVREILRSVDELGDLARASQKRMMGRLRIGVIPTIAPYLLPRLIGKLTQAHADLDIHVRETLTTKLLQELVDGRLDTAILALPASEPSLTEMPLFSEDFVLVQRSGTQTPTPPTVQTLRDMRVLLLEEGHCLRDQALSFCSIPAAGPAANSGAGLDGSSLSTLVQLAAAGIGVTLIPEMAIDVETKSAQVAISRFAAPAPQRTIGMVWRKKSPFVSELTEIAGIVRDAAADLRAG